MSAANTSTSVNVRDFPNGGGAAAVLAAGIGSFVVAVFAILADKIPAIKSADDLLQAHRPALRRHHMRHRCVARRVVYSASALARRAWSPWGASAQPHSSCSFSACCSPSRRSRICSDAPSLILRPEVLRESSSDHGCGEKLRILHAQKNAGTGGRPAPARFVQCFCSLRKRTC